MVEQSQQPQERGTLPPDQEKLAVEVSEMDAEVMALKARFDQYFLGIEKRNPARDAEDLKKRILHVRGQFIRNTALKFRVQTLLAKFQSYERLWLKTLQQIEEGTYKRDLFKLRRKNQAKLAAGAKAAKKDADLARTKGTPEEDLDDFDIDEGTPITELPPGALPPPAARQPGNPPAPAAVARQASNPPAPAAVARQPSNPPAAARQPGNPPRAPAALGRQPSNPPVTASADLSMEKITRIYNAYIAAKKQCRENTDGLTLDAVAKSLRKQVPKLLEEHKAKSVDFKIVIKDGKATLKAIPNK